MDYNHDIHCDISPVISQLSHVRGLLGFEKRKDRQKNAILYIFIPITVTEVLAVNKTGHFFATPFN